jgi:hypothetical protein
MEASSGVFAKRPVTAGGERVAVGVALVGAAAFATAGLARAAGTLADATFTVSSAAGLGCFVIGWAALARR